METMNGTEGNEEPSVTVMLVVLVSAMADARVVCAKFLWFMVYTLVGSTTLIAQDGHVYRNTPSVALTSSEYSPSESSMELQIVTAHPAGVF
jgi:hypothetical protein